MTTFSRRGAACSARLPPEPSADLIGDFGADLVVEQVLEGEPRASQVEEDLIESSILTRFGGGSVRMGAALSTETLSEHRADQLARGNSPGPRASLDSL
jgi:hypothetical protein